MQIAMEMYLEIETEDFIIPPNNKIYSNLLIDRKLSKSFCDVIKIF